MFMYKYYVNEDRDYLVFREDEADNMEKYDYRQREWIAIDKYDEQCLNYAMSVSDKERVDALIAYYQEKWSKQLQQA